MDWHPMQGSVVLPLAVERLRMVLTLRIRSALREIHGFAIGGAY